jgi:hypothetical protein
MILKKEKKDFHALILEMDSRIHSRMDSFILRNFPSHYAHKYSISTLSMAFISAPLLLSTLDYVYEPAPQPSPGAL